MPQHQEYREKWKDAGYPTRMGSNTVTLPPSREYSRLYSFVESKHAVSNISKSRIKVSRLNDLNDPFEFQSFNAAEEFSRKLLLRYRSQQNSKIGILCFSQNWINPVLWAQYGDRQRGICLGFDVKKKSVNRVKYINKRQLKHLAEESPFGEEIKKEIIFTKSKYWSHEEEFRSIVPLDKSAKENDLYFWNFGDDLVLREVILGCRCNKSLSSLRSKVARHDSKVPVFQARAAWNFFHMVPKESTVP